MNFDNLDNVTTFAVWCSFCNKEEQCGEVMLEVGGEQLTLPIGPDCAKKAEAMGKLIEVDTFDLE